MGIGLVILVIVLLLMLIPAAFLLGRHLTRRQYQPEPLSLVTRQHIHLFQGGQLNETLIEATKERFRELLERGDVETVESSLRPGIQYVVQVRALAEIGTDDAGRILERQLQRRLSEDELEQSWYWLDLASGLRSLNRNESLPHLLRCAESAAGVPLGHFFAAETVCFLGFAGYLQQLESPLGYAALRVLHRALEGLRHGVQPLVVVEARLGEVIERLWDNRPDSVHPLLVRVWKETLRLIRRAEQAQAFVPIEGAERESFSWQVSRLMALESSLTDYLDGAAESLCHQLSRLQGPAAADALHALIELRAECAAAVLPLLQQPAYEHADLAVEALTWSRSERAGSWLRAQVQHHLVVTNRHRFGLRLATSAGLVTGLRYSCPALLRGLRGHPGAKTEQLLIQATMMRDEECRMAAVSSLGWWEPILGDRVKSCLQQARRDPNPGVRQAARGALARLGERQAVNYYRQALTGEEPQQVHETIETIAVENLALLWPDVDRLAEADNPDVAQHARETVHQLFEEMDWDMRG